MGYCRPPVEHQFKRGQSGNPAGCPRGRSYFHWWITRLLNMTDGDLNAFAKGNLTQVQKAAVRAVRKIAKAGLTGVSWPAIRELMHYDEGKPSEHLVIEDKDEMSEEECEQVRQVMRRRLKGGEGK